MSESAALRLSNAIVSLATRLWLADAVTGSDSNLDDIIRRKVAGPLEQRRALRFLDEATDLLAERIISSTALESPSLTQDEEDIAANSVAGALDQTSIPEELVRADIDLATIEHHVRAVSDDFEGGYGLSAQAVRFREYLIQEASAWLLTIVGTLPTSPVNGFSELLRRDAQILHQLDKILETLPVRTTGISNDKFELNYRRTVVHRFDRMELFGVSIDESNRSYSLTTAYIALTAVSDGRPIRVDNLLNQTQRLLLLGDAGAGKSTFLRWIGVNAARRSLSADLDEWNSFVPFLIPLRQFAQTGLPRPAEFATAACGPMAGLEPTGWVSSVLANGRACILVDGADELPVDRLPDIVAWLSELVASFPNARYVVTSRPTGTRSNWLKHIGFTNATIQPMLQSEINAFIHLWHRAAAMERGPDSRLYDYNLYQRQLIDLITASRELHELAANPLLCALLCALNIRNRAHLPMDKLQFYDAAIQMLLEGRDAERGIRTYRVQLSYVEKLLILRDLAYWLVRNDRVYISKDQAVRRIGGLTRSFHGKARPDTVFEDLLQRSDVLREPAIDEIGFIHQSFQEYFAAGEAVFRDDIDFLIESATIERYRNVIVLAAGLANAFQRQQLIAGIIRKGDERPEVRRYLILLALGCAGNAPTLDAKTAETVRSYALEVLPPRNEAEKSMVADAGPSALKWLHARTGALSASYEAGTLSAEELQTEINRVWRDMRTSGEVGAEIAAAGFDRETLTRTEEIPITVYAEASGIDPSSVVLTVAFAPSASHVLKDLWAAVLLPRIRQRWGNDAIGTESR